MIFKTTEIYPKIFLLKFKTQKEVTRHFIRFQEHYESPKFRGKIFTLKEFKEWYKKETKKTKFTYYTDWSGFNIPSYVLKPFKEGKFNPLSKREKNILDIFKNTKGKFYIIAVFSEDDLSHEIMHSFYYTDKDYKKKVDGYLNEQKDLSEIKKLLKDLGYHKKVFMDEIHAWLGANSLHLKKKYGININKYKTLIKKLKFLYEGKTK